MHFLLGSFLSILFGYFIGSLHGSQVAQLLSGVNVKEQGVKNSGASNATIVLGWKYGVLVALIDIGKGIVSVLLLSFILRYADFSIAQQTTLLFLLGASVVLGHNYPVWLKFDGGKGTASVIGVLVALDWKFGLIGLGLLVVLSLLTDFLIIGVLAFYVTFLVYAIFFVSGIWPVVIVSLLFLLAIKKHLENIRRLREGSEPRVSHVLKKKKATPS